MQQVTLGTKNQIVLPKEVRKKIKGLKPGGKMNIYVQDEETIVVKPSGKLWADKSYGVLRETWKEQDPIAELEEMRKEWER